MKKVLVAVLALSSIGIFAQGRRSGQSGIHAQIGYGYEGLYPFLINAYGGAFGGYEVVNKGEKNINISDDLKSFRYGISGTIEAEFVVVRNLSITIDYTQFYDFKSKFSKSNGTIFGGLKYYIN